MYPEHSPQPPELLQGQQPPQIPWQLHFVQTLHHILSLENTTNGALETSRKKILFSLKDLAVPPVQQAYCRQHIIHSPLMRKWTCGECDCPPWPSCVHRPVFLAQHIHCGCAHSQSNSKRNLIVLWCLQNRSASTGTCAGLHFVPTYTSTKLFTVLSFPEPRPHCSAEQGRAVQNHGHCCRYLWLLC